ncbi:glycosyltransferase family 1 protein [Dyadobacter bucti]|uniref:glycosyltransferase family 1 protein n=1 Tax=Dyadobacter bucti TaxID=2572203 RepID=UPI001108341F|nr:glycosyltransferase family 1 protein [Dyadobacter bucti]
MKNSHKILILCNVIDFSAYTRRATLESIAKLSPGTKCISTISFWFKKETNLFSDFMEIIPFYYYFPYPLIRRFAILNFINHKINTIRTGLDLSEFDTVVLSRPHNHIFRPFIKDKKKVVILSDAYHTMGNTLAETRKVIEMADIIMATSMALKDVYVQKYYSITDRNIIYWPNCVDLDVWDPTKLPNFKPHLLSEKIVVGFAGNFMEATDIELLRDITDRMKAVTFVLAGKCNYKEDSEEYQIFQQIIKLPNVDYRGYIHYTELPQEVMNWDICIMIDAISEHASYHHHNKMYQYLALGKPVVYQKNHEDYRSLDEAAVGVTGSAEFVKELKVLVEKLLNGADFSEKAKYLASQNSSVKRAEQLLSII